MMMALHPHHSTPRETVPYRSVRIPTRQIMMIHVHLDRYDIQPTLSYAANWWEGYVAVCYTLRVALRG